MTIHHPPQSPTPGASIRAVAADARIAVIGIGCRYPGADNPVALWENILSRRQGFRRMPDCRLRLTDYHDPDRKTPDKTYSTRAGLIDGFVFDWAKRRIPKSTVEVTDIAHWLALEVALQAVADAGYGPGGRELPKDRTAAVLGNTLTGEQCRALSMRLRWPFVARAITAAAVAQGLDAGTLAGLLEETEAQYKSVFPAFDEDTLAGNLSNTIPGRVCNYLDLHGGGYVVDGACSSSLLATISAADALVRGDIDVALAGGVDISIDTFELIGFSKVGALTPTEMRVYDKRASGFIPGEGCGIVILKRYADALRDGDAIYATLCGWGISSDGKGGITAPTVRGQALALERAYRRAGYPPQALDFIEGHGTGTPVGDAIELKGIQLAHDWFAAEAEPAPATAAPAIGITSFKSLVGHTKAAAGIGGLIKAVMAVNRRIVPPTVGCAQPSPVFEQDARVLYPLLRGEARSPEANVRAGVSAMGFGGINSHITLESGPKPDNRLTPTLSENALLASYQDSEVFPLAAATRAELVQAAAELLLHCRGMAVGEMPDLSAQSCQRAEALGHAAPHRAAVVAEDPLGLADALERLLAKLEEPDAAQPGEASSGSFPLWHSSDRRIWLSLAAANNTAPQAPRVGWVFPGQGAQFIGCAAHLLARLPWAQAFLAQADAWLAEVGSAPVSALLYPAAEYVRTEAAEKAWATRLAKPAHTEPVVIFSTVLWCKYLRDELGLEPCIVAGHSLGELAALYVAGALDDKEVIQLAAIRGQAMAECQTGAMLGLGCDAATAQLLIEQVRGYLVIANINSPRQTIVSGDETAIKQLESVARQKKVAGRRLGVSGAFHSKFVEPAGRAVARDPRIRESASLAIPWVTSMADASSPEEAVKQGRIALREHVGTQIFRPVDFMRVGRSLAEGCDLVIELGPGRTLSGLLGDQFAARSANARPFVFPVEARAERRLEFHQLVAVLFATGAPLRLQNLFAGRAVRAFVPAQARAFIANYCEGLPASPEPRVARPAQLSAAAQHDAWLPIRRPSGLTPEQFAAYASERAEFLESVTQVVAVDARSRGFGPAAPATITRGAVAPVLNRASRQELGAEWSADQSTAAQLRVESAPEVAGALPQPASIFESTPEAEVEISRSQVSAPAAAPESSDALQSVATTGLQLVPDAGESLAASSSLAPGRQAEVFAYIQDRVSQRTGFPPDSLTPDLRLLDDLNLDSIKTAELSAEAAAHFQIEPAPDAMRVANASLEELAVLLSAELPAAPPRGPEAVVSRAVPVVSPEGASTSAERYPGVRADAFGVATVGAPQPANTLAMPAPDVRATDSSGARIALSEGPEMIETLASPISGPDVLTEVCERVAQRTGYPKESLDPGLRLLDDLNLDSIKVAELVGELAQACALDVAALDATRFANASLGELAEALNAQTGTRASDAPRAPARVEATSAQRTPAGSEARPAADALPAPAASPRERLISRVAPVTSSADAPRFSSERASEVRAAVPAKARIGALPARQTQEAAGAPWVRHFAQEWRVDALGKPARTDWPAGQRVRVAALGSASGPDAERFSGVLGRLGGQSEVLRLDASLRSALDASVAALCVFYTPTAGALSFEESVAQLAALAQALPAARPDLALAFIEVGEATAHDGFVCGLAAFAASLHHERPSLRVRVLELPAACPSGECAGFLGAEFGTPIAFDHVRYDTSGERWITGHRLLQPEQSPPRRVRLGSGDVVLVTGGAKGITGACAAAWASRDGVTLALVGRSPHARVAAELDALRAQGIRCEYFSVDLADPAAVDALVAQVHVRLGHIRAVVHGAGLNQVRRAELVNAESARAEVAPKLHGALALLEALERRQTQQLPDLIIGLTSVIGVTGMPGNAWYAFANDSLDRSLAHFAARHPQVEVSTLAYSVWSDVGMGHRLGSVEALARTGTAALSPDQGVEGFLALVDVRPSAQQVIVTSRLGGLDTWRSLEPALPATGPGSKEHLRFIDEVICCEPGVEAIVRTTLSVEHDDFIRDHCFEGRYLLPAVFGLEAMAQAVALVAGRVQLTPLTVENAEFFRPVDVSVEASTAILITVRATSAESVTRFGASLSTANGTIHPPVCFKAKFALGLSGEYAENQPPLVLPRRLPVDLELQGVYGTLLFHGPTFRRVSAVHDLTDAGGLFSIDDKFARFPASSSGRWVLGDPFARDAQLQCLQLSLSPGRALPMAIDTLRVHRTASVSGRRAVRTQVVDRIDGKLATVRATVCDENGDVTETMEACSVRIVATDERLPRASDIRSGWLVHERALRSKIDFIARTRGLEPPAVRLRFMPGLQTMSREDRHQHEAGLLADTVASLRATLPPDGEQYVPEISWDAQTGKPLVSSPELGVSLSQDNLLCLVVAGVGSQGCDLATVNARTESQWRQLLGEETLSLAGGLIRQGWKKDAACTALWAIHESVFKESGDRNAPLHLLQVTDDQSAVFRAKTNAGEPIDHAVFQVSIGQVDYIVAMSAGAVALRRQSASDENQGDSVGLEAKSTPDSIDGGPMRLASFEYRESAGPQSEDIFVHRFPLSCVDIQSLLRRVRAGTFATWAGKVRELFGLESAAYHEKLYSMLGSNELTSVTNEFSTEIIDHPVASDLIEVHFFVTAVSPEKCTLVWHWFARDGNGHSRRRVLGRSLMDVSAVKVISHGVVRPDPWPDFFLDYNRGRGPKSKVSDSLARRRTSAEIHLGDALFQREPGPKRGPLLHTHSFETGLAQSNLVGNVYFSNYIFWQEAARDWFVHGVSREYLEEVRPLGEFLCTDVKVKHLNETMPFSTIEVEMTLDALFTSACALSFDYFRVKRNGERVKLATGSHTAVWYAPSGTGIAVAEIPEGLVEAMLDRAKPSLESGVEFVGFGVPLMRGGARA